MTVETTPPSSVVHLRLHAFCSIWQQYSLWEANSANASLDGIFRAIWCPCFLGNPLHSAYSDVLTTVARRLVFVRVLLLVSTDAVSTVCQITCLRACGCGTCRDSVCWPSWSRRLLCAALSGTHADLDWLSAPETPKCICGHQLAACLWMYQLKVWIQFHHSACLGITIKQAFTPLPEQNI